MRVHAGVLAVLVLVQAVPVAYGQSNTQVREPLSPGTRMLRQILPPDIAQGLNQPSIIMMAPANLPRTLARPPLMTPSAPQFAASVEGLVKLTNNGTRTLEVLWYDGTTWNRVNVQPGKAEDIRCETCAATVRIAFNDSQTTRQFDASKGSTLALTWDGGSSRWQVVAKDPATLTDIETDGQTR